MIAPPRTFDPDYYWQSRHGAYGWCAVCERVMVFKRLPRVRGSDRRLRRFRCEEGCQVVVCARGGRMEAEWLVRIST